MTTRRTFAVALLVGAALVTGCAGPNPMQNTAGTHGVAGFWLGLWHGLICVITFVISLFNANVHMYEVHNSGGWYDCGFIIGAASSLGGGARSTCR